MKLSDLTFVGIHIRRTDSSGLYVDKYDLPSLDLSYFLKVISHLSTANKIKLPHRSTALSTKLDGMLFCISRG